jgi:formylglycine-generating enzyme required for sulfatase activity
MRNTTIAAGCLCLAMSTGAWGQDVSWPDLADPAPMLGGGTRDAAVVVGISGYAFVSPVPGADANAKGWYSYLAETRGVPTENIRLLIDSHATREGILKAAREAAQRAGRTGTLWFVFIGHGAPAADGEDGLLVGMDAQQQADSLQERGVRRGELLALLAGSKARAIHVVIDACFSGRGSDGGAIVPGLQPLVTVAAPRPAKPRMVILTAAKGDQFAGPLPGEDRPAFSYLVLGGLRGWAAAQGKQVTSGDLWRYAKRVLESTLRGREQTPELIGDEKAVFGTSAGEEGPDLPRMAMATAGRNPSASAAPSRGRPRIQWVTIPGGTFLMGSDDLPALTRPRHRVKVPTFDMAKTAVTNAQYDACVRSGHCTPPHDGWPVPAGEERHPVVHVDWEQARAFSLWVGGRLPSEAEWEYAALSAGRDWKYPWGDGSATCERAVIAGCRGATAPVCSKTAGNTRQGLCDMAGNVWQWVQDWYHDSYHGAPADGSAWTDSTGLGMCRVVRGGSWDSPPKNVRSGFRACVTPIGQDGFIGFRPARSR